MNVSLTPELEKFVAKEVGSGLYQTAKSLDAGKGVNGEEVIRRLRKRMKEASA